MPRVLLCIFFFFTSLVACTSQATSPARVDVSGAWILREQISDEMQTRRMSLQVSRFTNKITGLIGPYKIDGNVTDAGITFKTLTQSGRLIASYTGDRRSLAWWLESDYKLNANESAIIPKAVLATLKHE